MSIARCDTDAGRARLKPRRFRARQWRHDTHMTMIENDAFAVPARLSKRGQLTRRGKGRLINRELLDGRTAVARAYDDQVAGIIDDLGGYDQVSEIEAGLVEFYVGAKVIVDHINAQIVAGAEITSALVAMHASATSAQVRCAAKLGTARRPKDTNGKSLGQLAKEDREEQRRLRARERERERERERVVDVVAE